MYVCVCVYVYACVCVCVCVCVRVRVCFRGALLIINNIINPANIILAGLMILCNNIIAQLLRNTVAFLHVDQSGCGLDLDMT